MIIGEHSTRSNAFSDLRRSLHALSSLPAEAAVNAASAFLLTEFRLRMPLFSKMGRQQAFLGRGGGGACPCHAKLSIRIAIRTLQEDTILRIDPIDLAHPKRA